MIKIYVRRNANTIRITTENNRIYISSPTKKFNIFSQGKRGFTGDVGPVGPQGLQGPQGEPGIDGADGVDGIDGEDGQNGIGIPSGGLDGYLLAKASNTDFDTEWIDPAIFASAAQGLLAFTALQPGDDVSQLVNDAGYLTDIAAFDTDDLTEGATNLYWTQSRFDTAFSAKDTDDLTEGSTNLYYTDVRADARITAQKAQNNGLATLDGSGKVPTSQLPALAITDTFVVASQAAMLALTAEVGDVAVRSDQNKSYILKTADPTILANWQELLTPTDSVLSVNGQTGAVSLTTTNINEGTNLYYTDERVDDRVAVLIQNGTGISWSYNDGSNTLTPTISLSSFSTSNLTEGSNLYYTDERVDDRVSSLIQNGTGISWSYNDGSNILTPTVSLASFSTTNLAEGSNLYYTDARVATYGNANYYPLTGGDLTGNIRLSGYMRVGSVSVPTNTTAGDITAVRINIGNGSQSANTVLIADTISSASANYRGLKVGTTFTGSGAGAAGLEASPIHQPSSSVSLAYGLINIAKGDPDTGVTITTLYGGAYRFDTGSLGGAVTNAAAMVALAPSYGSLKPTNAKGLRIENMAPSTEISLVMGIEMLGQSRGTDTQNIRMNYPLIGTGVDSTTACVGIDFVNASITLGDTTGTTTHMHGIRMGIPTFTNTTNIRTVTNMANIYIAGPPVASTNVTVTNGPYSLWIDAGTTRLDGDLDMSSVAANIIAHTATGMKIATATTQKLGFYNATPIVQPSAYTQTYSTADKTHANLTSATLTDNSGGTANTTLEALTSGSVYASDVAAIRNNFADLAASDNKIIADLTDLKQLVNSVIDDLQALGLVA